MSVTTQTVIIHRATKKRIDQQDSGKTKGCHSTEVTRMSAFSKGGENQEKSSKLLFYQYHFFDIGKL